MPSVTRSALAVLLAAGGLVATSASAATAPAPRHVFTIILENSEFEETFVADRRQAPYLTQTLPAQGTLAVNYYGTGHSSLDNYIAITSGQGPNAETQGDCDDPTTLGKGHVTFDADGQAVGSPGCTYPASVKSLSDQLDAVHVTWKGYMQGMDAQPKEKRTTCRNPFAKVEVPHKAGRPQAHPSYKDKHNPWSYYHATFDRQAYCDSHVVPLEGLATDLRSVATTPNYTWITPDQCDDGHDACNGKSQLQGADDFLKKWVPLITGSPAFKKDGLLIVTFDEGSSDLSCCGEKKAPNLGPTENNGYPVPGPVGDGGGKVGAIFIGKGVAVGQTDVTHSFNHYSYLRSMEDLFGAKQHLGYAGESGLQTFQEAGLFSS